MIRGGTVFWAMVVLMSSRAGWAWDRHDLITRTAIADLQWLESEVAVESIDEYVSASRLAENRIEFLKEIGLNPQVSFEGPEFPGQRVSIKRVLERYSDEPDWGMDGGLGEQNPALCNNADAQAMGGCEKESIKTSRHAYWPAGFLRKKFPFIGMKPLGEAPYRAAWAFALSQRAFAAGHPYWGARFLAWSLHYLEDVAQPYHTQQLPTPRFLQWRWGMIDGEASGQVVSYYHAAFERLVGMILQGGLGSPGQERLIGNLRGSDVLDLTKQPHQHVIEMATWTQPQAEEAGLLSLDIFPRPNPRRSLPDVASQDYWSGVQSQESFERDLSKMADFLEPIHRRLGQAIRTFVTMAAFRPALIEPRSMPNGVAQLPLPAAGDIERAFSGNSR